jgi:hypothetical protein
VGGPGGERGTLEHTSYSPDRSPPNLSFPSSQSAHTGCQLTAILYFPQVMKEKQSCVGLGLRVPCSRYMEGSVTLGSVFWYVWNG